MKRKILTLVILLVISSCFAFARTPSTISLGGKVQYGYKTSSPVNFGFHFDVKHYRFAFNADVDTNSNFDRMFFDVLLGANLFQHNYIEGNKCYHAFVVSLLGGAGFTIAVPKVKSYMAIAPVARLSLSWIFPFNLELKALVDCAYNIELSANKTKGLFVRAGIALSYSFDLEEEDYAHKSIRWRD